MSMSPGHFSDRPKWMQRLGWPASTWSPIGGAEYAFILVVSILSTIVGVLAIKAIGVPKPASTYLPSTAIAIAMFWSIRPRPDKLRDNRFWLQRTLLYVSVIAVAIVISSWLNNMVDGTRSPFFISMALTVIPISIVIIVPRATTERAPNEPRFHIKSVIMAVLLSVLIHVLELGFQAVGLSD